MVKVNRLKGLIVEKQVTQEVVAESIGVNRSTFYRKMKNNGDFSLEEAKKIKNVLDLTTEEAVDIFFND